MDIDSRRGRFCISSLFRSGLFRFRLCVRQDSLEGRRRVVVLVFCQKSELLFKLLNTCQGVRRKFSKEILILFRRTGRSFPENWEPILQTPRGLANVRFRPRTLAAAKRCRFESRFLSGRRESAISRGLVSRASWRWSVSVFEWAKEFRRPIRIPTTNSRNWSPTDLTS